MKGIFYNDKLEYREDIPKPVRPKGEAMIKVLKAGICRTDLEIAAGYLDFTGIPGHEFVGTVEEADDGSLVGCRVVGEINCGCGDCPACRTGNHNHCSKRTVLGIKERDGAFAEYMTLPEKNLHIVPDHISDDEAVFIEPLAAAFRLAEQIKVLNNDVLVLGDGKLGLLVAQVLAYFRADVTLCGKHPEKMALMDNKTINTLTPEELAPTRKFSVVVEATGRAEGLEIAFERIRPRGRLVLKSTVAKPSQIDFNRLVIDEITVIGSRCGPFEQAIALLETEAVKVTPLIEKTFSLEKGIKAFSRAGEPGAMKILIG